jgi:hypothetical protein
MFVLATINAIPSYRNSPPVTSTMQQLTVFLNATIKNNGTFFDQN